MSYVKVWLHCVWGTKSRRNLLDKEVRQKVFSHIKQNALLKNVYIDTIDGYTDHVHCLVSLNADERISDMMRILKGESSYWINNERLTGWKFEWAKEYFAVSVSESIVKNVREYIRNQENHHRKKTYQEECEEIMRRYNFKDMSGD